MCHDGIHFLFDHKAEKMPNMANNHTCHYPSPESVSQRFARKMVMDLSSRYHGYAVFFWVFFHLLILFHLSISPNCLNIRLNLNFQFDLILDIADLNHKRPFLPKQFSLRVEANILDQNYTTDIREWYDEINNRGSLEQDDTGIRSYGIYDYDLNELIVVVPKLSESIRAATFANQYKSYQFPNIHVAATTT